MSLVELLGMQDGFTPESLVAIVLLVLLIKGIISICKGLGDLSR